MTDHNPVRGDFSFVSCDHERAMLQDAYNAVDSLEGGLGWSALVSDPGVGGFMFNVPERGSIRHQIDIVLGETQTGGLHSGSSYGWVMRQMQGIATLGWSHYVHLRHNTENASISSNASEGSIHKDTPKMSSDTETTCRICFDPLENNMVVLCSGGQTEIALCGHKYHHECIKRWVDCRHNTCPACRVTIVSIHPLLV